ncbi:MAG: hypothetical protein KIT18_02675 [Burkholderiales bacterium]|nr:hypothetical protein [Burkholderiales bacterium]
MNIGRPYALPAFRNLSGGDSRHNSGLLFAQPPDIAVRRTDSFMGMQIFMRICIHRHENLHWGIRAPEKHADIHRQRMNTLPPKPGLDNNDSDFPSAQSRRTQKHHAVRCAMAAGWQQTCRAKCGAIVLFRRRA